MKRALKALLVAGTLALLAVGCGANATSINNKADKYDGKEVKLVGIVKQVNRVEAQPLLKQPAVTLYQIQDDSSTDISSLIWVVRGSDSAQKGGAPNANFRITVEGIVKKEAVYQNRKYSPIIIEKSAQEEIPKNSPGNF